MTPRPTTLLTAATLLVGLAIATPVSRLAAAEGDGAAIRKEAEAPPELAKAIDEGRAMLADGKTSEFLDRFVEPATRKKLEAEERWADVVERFRKEKAARLKQVLDAAAERKPVLSSDGAEAEYHVPGKPGERSDVRFVLVDGRWYLTN